MPPALSIHIGVDRVDPEHYGGWDGRLNACEKDARSLAAVARAQGIRSRKLLLTRDATAANVTQAIADAAARLGAGGLLFLTYSGHGGQVPDWDFEEDDDLDETWVLYDRQLLDDELHALWTRFEPGVRILVLSDSCHSGTQTRAPGTKSMPPELRDLVYRANQRLYDTLGRKSRPPAAPPQIQAHVLLISACQDDQQAVDGEDNGLFTATFLTVWDGGRFEGGHRRLRRRILDRMPPTQSPNLFVVGPRSRAFENEKPLTVQPRPLPRRDDG